jgi:hypothetical protein
MKQLLFIFASLLIFAACSDGDKPVINGMWQLKTIEDNTHTHVQTVDTIFYAFQRQSIFSYTVLLENGGYPASNVIYGYIDFPDPDHLHILLDEKYQGYNVLWQGIEVTYDIIRLDSKRMTLLSEGTYYYFNKY